MLLRSARLVLAFVAFFLSGLYLPAPAAEHPVPQTPEAIQRAIDHVLSDLRYCVDRNLTLAQLTRDPVTTYHAAVSLFNFVQTRVSPTRYGVRAGDGEAPPAGPLESLQARAGICGNQVAVYLLLARHMGLTARSVDFYWTDPAGQRLSHTAVEVSYGGRWHFLDVTWGCLYRRELVPGDVSGRIDVLSIDEVRALKDPAEHRIGNDSNLYYRFTVDRGEDAHAYLRAPCVLRGKGGVIDMPVGDKNLTINVAGLPDYLGVVTDHAGGANADLAWNVEMPSDIKTLHLTVKSRSCSKGVLRLTAPYGRQEVDIERLGPGEHEVALTRPARTLKLEVIPESRGTGYLTVGRLAGD